MYLQNKTSQTTKLRSLTKFVYFECPLCLEMKSCENARTEKYRY